MEITKAQRAAILTGLRLLQEKLRTDEDFEICDLFLMVYTNDGEHAGMNIEEIDTLCEAINAPGRRIGE